MGNINKINPNAIQHNVKKQKIYENDKIIELQKKSVQLIAACDGYLNDEAVTRLTIQLNNIYDEIDTIKSNYYNPQKSEYFSAVTPQTPKSITENTQIKQEIKNNPIEIDGVTYKIQNTSGENNNCLIQALHQNKLTKEGAQGIRQHMLTKYSIKEALQKLSNDVDYIKIFVNNIYPECDINNAKSIEEISSQLARHIQNTDCTLDAQLILPILAKKLGKDVVLYLKLNKGEKVFYILNTGEEVSKEEFNLMITDSSKVAKIYLSNGHFEYLK